MKPIGFLIKAMIIVIALILAAGEVNANTGIKPGTGLSEESSIIDIPLPGRYAISAAIGSDREIFHVKTAGSDYEAVNPEQSLIARFSSSGVGVSRGGA